MAVILLSSCGVSLPEEVETAYEELPEEIDFNFHVKPILSDRCYACHGPDENSRKAGLRLDLEEYAFARLKSGNRAFVSGNASKSESVTRILSEDPEIVMPPEDSHLNLSDREKAIIIKWIEQGAKWKEHWAFTTPQKPEPPATEPSWSSNNAIDQFVQSRLKEQGFQPSAEAEKERLLRRVYMDLTGLPPTIDELDSFLEDKTPEAYEKVVDKLLTTDAFAERMALDWMDLSRYADSHGLHADGWRLMWPWRDWVINAFKDNMPYDQFVTWQLAGDLMPDASKEQKLATAFNRNHPMTAEGGAIDEEFRLNYVWDRAETVGTSLLGLTMNCARCHDHKFDPISQKDYYKLTAFFNNVKELGMTGDDGNYGPMLALPDPETEKQLESLQKEIQIKEKQLALTKKEKIALDTYIRQLPKGHKQQGLLGHFPFDALTKDPNKKRGYFVDGNKKVTSLEAPIQTEGVKGKALRFTGEYDEVYLREIPNFELTDKFSAVLWANTTKREVGKTQTLLGTSGNKNNFWRGWDFYLDSLNRVNARLINSLPHNYIHVRSKDSIKTNQWYHLGFSYSGTGKAAGLNLFVNGVRPEMEVVYDRLYKSIKTIRVGDHQLNDQPVRVAKSGRAFTGENGIFKGMLDDIYFYSRALQDQEVKVLAEKAGINENPAPDYWVEKDPEVREAEKSLHKLRADWLSLMEPVMEVMVMEELSDGRQAFAYNRGDYEQPTYEVQPGTPETLPEFPEGLPANRLGLAQWIFSDENPLTARVAVNRYWQMIFGKGLVDTPQDFGVQGSLPSHPQMLDWLATEFMENDWDIRYLLKQMVMSHTYRQSSLVSDELREADPNNYYLARSNSYRLPAEMIRDNALAASGLLVQTVGGKSVKPYQPPDLWIEQTNFSHILLRYKESGGDSLYRRGLYTFIRRTAPHPAMIAFDAPPRDVCTIKRENTNTPLQALVLLNDTQFVEASKILAVRMLEEGGDNREDQIVHGFRLATSRFPKKEEIEVLTSLYDSQSEKFEKDPQQAKALLTVGRKQIDPKLKTAKTAALTMVASTILNHDETYMKR
ncbi:DUF1553 domain-containing protein [Flavobacteriaceae bacterium R33]|uniref:DUF1553 domain-containing protein n=2 Tax=Poritiphilus flavus TaxID=2697053 RepID=A0A6L9E9P6_9FLAO|nr:DUF1553 domain-containing protein [Poritiphilus flavus]